MNSSNSSSNEQPNLLEVTRAANYAEKVCETMQRIASAASAAEAIGLLKQASTNLGANAAIFTSFIRDDATFATYRVLLACDPAWGTECARNAWFADDPWLLHALRSTEPIRGSELTLDTPRQQAFVETAAQYGFRSALIVPAPSSAGRSRVGVLCVGSAVKGYFESEGCATVKLLARPLAMELHHWLHERIKRELIANARITADDLALLRHEEQGHSSKVIALELNTHATTIDCRFQRLSAKLGAPNRRAAVRVAKLYGLI